MRKPLKLFEAPKSNRLERIKLVYDFLKHLTTLSSGAILVTLALAEKFFKDSSVSSLLFAGAALFLTAILASVFPMAILAVHVDKPPSDEATANTFAAGFLGAAICFLAGMLLVAASIVWRDT